MSAGTVVSHGSRALVQFTPCGQSRRPGRPVAVKQFTGLGNDLSEHLLFLANTWRAHGRVRGQSDSDAASESDSMPQLSVDRRDAESVTVTPVTACWQLEVTSSNFVTSKGNLKLPGEFGPAAHQRRPE